MSRRRRDERGAAALLFALLGTVLLGVGALSVDIGQAYAKRSLEQTDVDVAVMAAATELNTPGDCNPEVVAKATEYLSKSENIVPGQAKDASGNPLIDLTGSPGDSTGYISCKNWRVDLWAPSSRVDFALAGALPSAPSGIDVDAHAAAQIKAARAQATLPFFAVQGCDTGQQSIRNDSGPQLPIPPLNPDTPAKNSIAFTVAPDNTPTGTTSLQVTLTGTSLDQVDEVGFTGAAGPPYHFQIPRSQFVGTPSATSITVNVPAGVLAVEDVWYVRTLAANKWTKPDLVQRFTVGPPKLYCDNSLEGNFGTIDLPRSDTSSFTLQYNMIKGIEVPLGQHPSPNGQCDGQAGSVVSTTTPVPGTNCVATEPGLKIAQTNEGMITGVNGLKGRLDTDSTSNCSRNGDSSRTAATVKNIHVNDDILTCFITNDAHISDLVAGNSVGKMALSSDIYNSPRFFWLPVLDTDPSTGKKYWPIIDFRPGFITDQSLSASRTSPGSISAVNGIVPDANGIKELKVVLFSKDALPAFAPTVGGESDYTGTGPKALVLVE